jgi:citrate lyase beta subunit
MTAKQIAESEHGPGTAKTRWLQRDIEDAIDAAVAAERAAAVAWLRSQSLHGYGNTVVRVHVHNAAVEIGRGEHLNGKP